MSPSNQASQNPKRIYTPAEFAEEFGKEKTWAYRLIWAGRIRVLDLPGEYSIPVEEASRLVANSRFLTTSKKTKTK